MRTFAKRIIQRLLPQRPIPIRNAGSRFAKHNVDDVEAYYQEMTPAYMQGFGDVFQGSRPESTEELLHYIAASAALHDGMHILDAGCGICGPSIWFAQQQAINIEAITISQAQVDIALQHIDATTLKGTIHVRRGDFHNMDALYPSGQFDRVLMLESLCHAEDYRKVLSAARAVLKRGGGLYIKDFYCVDHRSQPDRIKAAHADLEKLNAVYTLAMPDLATLIDLISELGFFLHYVRTPDYEPTYRQWAEYEHIAGRSWAPSSGAPGELIQGFELYCTKQYD